jgi:hypothetical protein
VFRSTCSSPPADYNDIRHILLLETIVAEASERVKKQVLNLLRGREVKRINFTFPGGAGDATVNAASYERVAAAIEAGTVKLEIPSSFPAGVGASYLSGTPNRIEFPTIVGRVQEMHFVHESFHCVCDLDTSNVMAVEEECAGMTISMLYAAMTGLRDARVKGHPWDEGGVVASKLLKAWATNKTATTFNVDATAWAALRTAIVGMPIYSSISSSPGVSYTHDG